MYKIIFSFVIGKIIIIINYYLFEKLFSCEYMMGSFIWCFVSLLILFGLLNIIFHYHITLNFLRFFATMGAFNMINFIFFNLVIIFYNMEKLSCPFGNGKGFIPLEIIFVIFGIMVLFAEITFFIKTLLEYQKISNHMRYDV